MRWSRDRGSPTAFALFGGIGVGVTFTLALLALAAPAPSPPAGCGPSCGAPPLLFAIGPSGNFSNGTVSLYNFTISWVANTSSGTPPAADWMQFSVGVAGGETPPGVIAHLVSGTGNALALFNFSQSTWSLGGCTPNPSCGGWVTGGSTPLGAGQTVELQAMRPLHPALFDVDLEMPPPAGIMEMFSFSL